MPLASLIERRPQSALNDKLPILNAFGIIKRLDKNNIRQWTHQKQDLKRFVQQNGYEQHLTVSRETHRQMKDATGIKH